jgi:hypothetical protein
MSVRYTIFGYDERWEPTVAANVTADQAKAFALAKGLTNFLAAPQDNERVDNAGIIAYKRDEKAKGGYARGKTREWVADNLLQNDRDVLLSR